jgi:hypothetical protein
MDTTRVLCSTVAVADSSTSKVADSSTNNAADSSTSDAAKQLQITCQIYVSMMQEKTIKPDWEFAHPKECPSSLVFNPRRDEQLLVVGNHTSK